jgi:hypothetical protein
MFGFSLSDIQTGYTRFLVATLRAADAAGLSGWENFERVSILEVLLLMDRRFYHARLLDCFLPPAPP